MNTSEAEKEWLQRICGGQPTMDKKTEPTKEVAIKPVTKETRKGNGFKDIAGMEKLKERLGGQFLSCHKSYVVNMEYIQEFRGNEIILVRGDIIPVSKRRHKEARDLFFSYISEHI